MENGPGRIFVPAFSVRLRRRNRIENGEYGRRGTAGLLAGIDRVIGKVHAPVEDRHRRREFIEFLELLDAAYPAHTAIEPILDSHAAQALLE